MFRALPPNKKIHHFDLTGFQRRSFIPKKIIPAKAKRSVAAMNQATFA